MAFVSDRDGKNEIYLMNRYNKKIHRLTNNPKSVLNFFPAWSPDGQWIAFTSKQAGEYHIFKIDVDSGNLQQLTDEGYNMFPTWSPDGQQIAFYSSRDQGNDIFVMNANGRRLRRIIQRDHGGGSPNWSPDGKWIAYTLGIAGTGIYIMSPSGQNNRRVTPENVWSYHPAWSLDGQWIAYEAEVENPWGNPKRDSNIYLVSPAGGKPRRLTDHPARDRFPAWGTCGPSLCFSNCEYTNDFMGQTEKICS